MLRGGAAAHVTQTVADNVGRRGVSGPPLLFHTLVQSGQNPSQVLGGGQTLPQTLDLPGEHIRSDGGRRQSPADTQSRLVGENCLWR